MNLKKLSTWQLEHMLSYLLLYKNSKSTSLTLSKEETDPFVYILKVLKLSTLFYSLGLIQ